MKKNKEGKQTMTNNIYYNQGNGCYIGSVQYFGFHFATFKTFKQLKAFIARFGGVLKITDKHIKNDGKMLYTLDSGLAFVDAKYYFKNKKDLPKGVKPIEALSNGSIVKCYYTIDNNVVTFFRPNPNAKNVYKPLSIKECIAFRNENGIY